MYCYILLILYPTDNQKKENNKKKISTQIEVQKYNQQVKSTWISITSTLLHCHVQIFVQQTHPEHSTTQSPETATIL